MSRSLAFDRDIALRAALKLFWRQGYNTTSLAELLTAMDISRSSFYATYGSKREIFIEALDRYIEIFSPVIEFVRDCPSPTAAIEHLYSVVLDEESNFDITYGCMAVNTSVELSGLDQDLAEHVRQQSAGIEQAFNTCFENAIKAGRYQTPHDVETLTRLFTIFNSGMRVAMRNNTPKQELQAVLHAFTKTLGEDVSPLQKSQQT